MSNINIYHTTKAIYTEIDRLRESGREISKVESDCYYQELGNDPAHIKDVGYYTIDNRLAVIDSGIHKIWKFDNIIFAFTPENLRQLIIDVWGDVENPDYEYYKTKDRAFSPETQAEVIYNHILGFNGLYWQSPEKALEYLLEQLKNVK